MDATGFSVSEDVRAILADVLQIGERAQDLKAESLLLGALPELDSLAVVNVITAIEERFDVSVEDEEITADVFATFGDLCAYVGGKIAA